MNGQDNLGFSESPIELNNFRCNGSTSTNEIENSTIKDTISFKNEIKRKIILKLLIHLVFIAYFIWATCHYVTNGNPIDWESGYGCLLIFYIIAYILVLYRYLKKYLKSFTPNEIFDCFDTKTSELRWRNFLFYLAISVITIGLVIFLIFDTVGQRHRLISLLGLFIFLVFGFAFSKHPKQVKWRPVITGLFLQFFIGFLTIRLSAGRIIFEVIGDKVTTFLNFTNMGAQFIYGDFLVEGANQYPPVFAFATLPVIFFVSFCVNILYYYNIMQTIVTKFGWFLGLIMNTTICESVNSASNIFLGMTESPLLLRPYLQNLTKSEMFAVMASGFASVAGTVLAAYISFGAKASHLITASVMSAPAALCFSKLFYPETELSFSTVENIKIEKNNEATSVIDAAARGANSGVEIVMGIIANVIAFVSFIAFLNSIVLWLGTLVGYSDINFEFLVAKLFIPISWVMGVTWSECSYVSELIALKTVVNEFVAYKKLGEYKKSGLLNARSEMIATYAICGFSNPSSVGIMIGTMSILVPHARQMITELSIRAVIAGAIVCFMTACIAGLLVEGSEFES